MNSRGLLRMRNGKFKPDNTATGAAERYRKDVEIPGFTGPDGKE